MGSRIPPLLEPHLNLPPESSLTLLTSVLGASSNWLLLRSLYSYLRATPGSEDVGVVLVSFLRDGAFWREGGGKLGLDLDGLERAGRFVYVDGVTGLVDASPRKERVLKSLRLGDVKREIEAAIADLRTAKKILIIDQIDAYLATTSPSTTSLQLQDTIFSLRERVHATLLSLAADHPLVTAQQTTLEREHAALLLAVTHAADGRVLMCRMLDTGTARDVSGVVRVGAEAEFLYYVAADGGVRVFERGT